MGKTIDMMGAIELDALGVLHDTPRHISGVQVEADVYYRERLKVVIAEKSPMQMPPMSLRDYFAAKAIQGMFANDAMLARFSHDGANDLIDPQVLAVTAAYSIADAMIAERAK